MKKIYAIILIFGLIICGALIMPEQKGYDYLRLHIRANSNLNIDQNIKYEIKNEVVKFLTPYLCTVPNKEKAKEIIKKYTSDLKNICNKKLQQNGFSYTANIKINNEYFPTRSYEDLTLEGGYYDAVIIELGEAKGDNWWCVMYPPLCFVNKIENNKQIKYKSKILEWFNKIFG